MAMIKSRTFWNYDPREVSDATGLKCTDPSRAIQSQKDEADINTIVRNFGVTGKLPENVRVPMYEDFSEVGDFRDAMDAIRAAERSFAQMPSELRVRLNHDPQRFLEYCADPANLEEMRKLGLAVPAPVPAAVGAAS